MLRLSYVLVLLCIATSAQAFDVVCEKAWDGMHERYPVLVCTGDRLMLEGRYSKALETYEEAARLDFFESPNFIAYFRIARAQCALGRFKDCTHTLMDFESMLDVYVGKIPCPDPEGKSKFSRLAKRVVMVMCGEILQGTYIEKLSSSLLEMERSYRRQVAVLRSQYKLRN